ncbi:disease resistance protein RPM1-like [Cryptomeria japonica]|uniref:disease resistance protein RPM1-like n=1 Tax=Cryptomeria japonica TaxID=3369 RepID=UPI0027DA71E7|nr:disease resistance protein RPM1-like [Cryptomeria japonica]
MRLLRVLDLTYTQISTLPHCIGKLKLLKLLNLSSTRIEEVPICVRSLKSLLMLYLSRCKQLQRLPEWINELKCLQYLNILHCHDDLQSHMPKGISELVSLRVLRSGYLRLSVEDDGLLKLQDVAKLTHLQVPCLWVQHEKELKSIEDGILAQLLKMRDLSIASGLSTETHLPQNITALQDLQILALKRFAFPNWVCTVINLRQLTLKNCHSSDYPGLEAMPNLIRLKLDVNERCREIPKAFGKSAGFPKLRFLIIKDFPVLKELPDLEDGAMGMVEILHIVKCGRVKKVPEGVEGLRKLRVFRYGETGTDQFRESLREDGEVWNKIKAKNPHVDIKAKVEWD